MIALTTWTGGILTATGLIAYFTTGMESATSLIPAFIGVLLLIAAFIASRVPNASRGVMIAALVIAVLGHWDLSCRLPTSARCSPEMQSGLLR